MKPRRIFIRQSVSSRHHKPQIHRLPQHSALPSEPWLEFICDEPNLSWLTPEPFAIPMASLRHHSRQSTFFDQMPSLIAWLNDARIRTLLIVNFAAVVEKADEALLPAVYREIGITFNASPTELGTLTLIRSLFQALSFPLAAYLALGFDRIYVIALGALMWGVATSAVGFSIHYWQVVLARAANGVGLALVIPAIQSLVADAAPAEKRGQAFGWLSLLSNFGALAGGALAVILAGHEVCGISGWRIAFHLVAIASYVLASFLYFFAIEPPSSSQIKIIKKRKWKEMVEEVVTGGKEIMKIKTFQIIIAQGIIGSFPWASLAFTAMWLELIGFSHNATASLVACFSVTSSLGALFGGWLGDKSVALLSTSGRIVCAQISSGIAVPLSLVLLVGLPKDSSFYYLYAFVLSITGFLISWNSSSTNNPIFAEIVPERLRTNIYALDRTFEMGFSSFAPPLVGLIAENCFNFVQIKKTSALGTDQASSSAESEASHYDLNNAMALSYALVFTMTIPFALCCLTYTSLYWIYPVDRENVLSRSPVRVDEEIEGSDDGSLGLDGVGSVEDRQFLGDKFDDFRVM